MGKQSQLSVKQVYLLAILVFGLTAWFSQGFNHFDEHFQVIEFAGLKLGLTQKANLPWEYGCMMRPAIQPLAVYAIHSAVSGVLTRDPFFISFIIRLLSSALAFFCIHLVYRYYSREIAGRKLLYTFLLLSFFLWFVPYNAARFSSETLAGRIFLIGLAGFLLNRDHKPANYLLAGVILGLSFIVRYQVAFMIIGFGAWLIFMQKTGLRNLLAFTLGFLLLTAIGIIIDRWFYGEWVLTAWNYFRQNLVLGKAAGFGTSPWWYYFSETFMNAIPPFSLVYILAVSLYACFFPRDILTWSAMPFVIAHFIIPHKEIRFLFPIIGFLPVMIVRVAAQVKQRTGEVQVNKRWVQLLVNLFWITNMAMLVLLIFRPADDRISLYKKLWYDYPGPSKLYFMGENPYHRAKVDVHYYKRKSLVFVPTDSLNQITLSKDTISLLVTDNPEPPGSSSFQPVLIYSSLPSWVKKFNVNHWIERTSFWYVYELKSIPDKPVYH